MIAAVLLISSNLKAATFPIAENGGAYGPRQVYRALTDGLSLAPGQYQFDLNLSGVVWQKGNDSHGWEPTDRIILQAFLNGVPIAEIVKQGLDGQDQKFAISLLLDFAVEDESKLQITAFADVSSKNERWKVSNADLNGLPIIPIPIQNTFPLLASGLLCFVGLRRYRYKRG